MTETVSHPVQAHEETVDGHGAAHPSDAKYVKIAAILAVFTAIEVATYFVDFGPLQLPTLFGLMIVKFVLVAGFFMHLRFDNPLFRRTFVAGLLLAIAVYVGALAAFQVFDSDQEGPAQVTGENDGGLSEDEG